MRVTELNNRIRYLQKLIENKEKALEKAPAGTLKCSRHGKTWQYYCRTSPSDTTGKYIRKSQLDFAHRLAQKIYDRKAISSAQAELEILEELRGYYENGCAEDIFMKLPEAQRKVVTPIEEPVEQLLERWVSEEYQPKRFFEDAPVYYSDKHEAMRSKSEILIANMLHKYRVPYHYEKPLQLKGYGTVYPDFTILDLANRREVYWEHLGMLDDNSYLRNALAKVRNYERNGLFPGDRLILSFETHSEPLDMLLVEKQIRRSFTSPL